MSSKVLINHVIGLSLDAIIVASTDKHYKRPIEVLVLDSAGNVSLNSRWKVAPEKKTNKTVHKTTATRCLFPCIQISSLNFHQTSELLIFFMCNTIL